MPSHCCSAPNAQPSNGRPAKDKARRIAANIAKQREP
jgi:hypothetical protein